MLKIIFSVILVFMMASITRSADLTSEKIKEDPRLEKTVSVSSRYIFVGELFDELKEQTGIDISAGTSGTDSADILYLGIKNLSVKSVMRAVYSLLSHRSATWDWQVTGRGEKARYVLIRTLRAKQYNQTLRDGIQKDFEDHVRRSIKLAELPSEEIENLKTKSPAEYEALKNPDSRNAIKMLSILSDDELNSLLKGGKLKLPVSKMPDYGKTEFLNRMSWHNEANGFHNTLEGVDINFYIWTGEITPAINMSAWTSPGDGPGGGQYLGGSLIDDKWRKSVDEDWMLPGDSSKGKEDASKIHFTDEELKNKIFSALVNNIYSIPEILNHSTANYIGLRLDNDRTLKINQYNNYKINDFQKSIENKCQISYKWSNNIMLLRPKTFFMLANEKGRTSWFKIKDILKKNTGKSTMSTGDYFRLCQEFNSDQLLTINQRLPFLRLDVLVDLYDMFHYVTSSQKILNAAYEPKGILLTKNIIEVLRPVYGDDSFNLVDSLYTLHIEESDGDIENAVFPVHNPGPKYPYFPARILKFILNNKEGRRTGELRFFYHAKLPDGYPEVPGEKGPWGNFYFPKQW